jgi:hypothetical protein
MGSRILKDQRTGYVRENIMGAGIPAFNTLHFGRNLLSSMAGRKHVGS